MSPAGAGLAGIFQSLEQDLVTAEVVSAFEVRSIPVVLLKGPTFGQWLYAPGETRPYCDSDVLVPRARFRDAAAALQALGFRREVRRRSWRHVHAVCFLRGARQVDLHHTLNLVDGSFDAWSVLTPTTAVVRVGGRDVPALDEPGRCLHVALHAAHSRKGAAKPREDLRRALLVADDSVWAGSAQLARALRCEPELAAGLRLLPEGARRADRLGLTTQPSVRLAAQDAPTWQRLYLQVRLQRSWRARAGQVLNTAGAGLARLHGSGAPR